MTETLAPLPAEESEWTVGWRIVLGCALGAGAGIVLLFFTFNMFVLPLSQELGVSRGELGSVQALIVTGALGAVVIGRAADRFGFKPIYLGTAAIVIIGQVLSVLFSTTLLHMAITIAVLGFFGVGTTAVVITRPVNAHFRRYRGRALGLVATGTSLFAIAAPQVLEPMIANYGWRGGFLALAGFMALVGMPAVAFIVPASASRAYAGAAGGGGTSDWSFLKTRDFQLMAASIIAMGLATAGFVGQLSPIIQEEGFGPATGALAVSIFAIGQFVGRLGGGWLLDTFRPQVVALVFTIIPGSGFLLLLLTDQLLPAVIIAAAMIGLQQGVEIDLFAYFIARRFPITQYGTIYGALHGFSWIGNGIGIVGVGWLHDKLGSYELAQGIGMASLTLGAVLVWAVRLPPLTVEQPRAG
ncbi:MFS transporter [Novosphingobium sp. APW14]|uniref:MFS transporter n=1 Tax=Novosphingobium sp. APW14 TaxID=3077237 RepID=UPI0028DF3C32|nr:MFS transporter [Novosphingobium sp. APW14]MDT9013799.1 MFS transporter [Novosphingobium sp. APW14]